LFESNLALAKSTPFVSKLLYKSFFFCTLISKRAPQVFSFHPKFLKEKVVFPFTRLMCIYITRVSSPSLPPIGPPLQFHTSFVPLGIFFYLIPLSMGYFSPHCVFNVFFLDPLAFFFTFPGWFFLP